MSDLPMKQEDHPAHNMPEPTESYSGEEYQDSGNQALDYAHKPANDMMKDRQYAKVPRDGKWPTDY